MPMIRPVTDTCWKKTYLMPSDSIRCVSASMRSRRPGWLRASSSVAGAGAMRGLAQTVATVPPNEGLGSSATLPLPSPMSTDSFPRSPGRSKRPAHPPTIPAA